MDRHIFISYKHEDREFATELVDRIEAEGFITLVDDINIHAGTPWRREIDQSIKEAFALIVVLSPAARASEYVTY